MYIYYVYIYINLLHSAAPYCTQPQSSVKSSANPTRTAAQRDTVPVTLPSASSMSSDVGLGAGAAAGAARGFFKGHRFCGFNDGLIKKI